MIIGIPSVEAVKGIPNSQRYRPSKKIHHVFGLICIIRSELKSISDFYH